MNTFDDDIELPSQSSFHSNYKLENHTIFIAVFFTQLTAIVAQGSLRSNALELFSQIIIWGIMLGFSLAFGWSYLHKSDAKENKLAEQLTNIVAVIGMMAFLFQMVSGDITSAILLMLSWLLIALSFSFKTQRNLYFSLFASTTLLLYAASISKSSSFIIYITIYTLAAIIALASNFYLSKTKQQINEAKTHSGFPFKRPITVLAGAILLITAGFYLLVPRPSAINWGFFPAGGGRYQAHESWPKNADATGKDALSELLEKLGKIGNDKGQGKNKEFKEFSKKIKLEQQKVQQKVQQAQKQAKQRKDAETFYYVGFNEELKLNERKGSGNNFNTLILYMEGNEPQYLRGQIYDHFDGLSWKVTKQKEKRIDRKDNKFTINKRLKEPFSQYTVTMAVNLAGEPTIFSPASTAEIQFPGNAIAIDNYGALSAPRSMEKNTFYSMKVKQDGNKLNGRPVDITNEPSKKEIARYTQLPKSITDKFINFSREISEGASSSLHKAEKIEKYLRNNYEYSLDTVVSSQGKIPLEEFLFERPVGHCEYFATSMVTLMRAQNIPARLVTGFSVTNFNPVTGYYEARGLDAHAWAEVWIPDTGWVTFEATPPYALPTKSAAGNTSESIEEYLQKRSSDAKLTDPDSLKTAAINTVKYFFEQFNILLKKTWSGLKTTISWTGNMLLYYGWLILLGLAGLYAVIHYLRYYLLHRRVKKALNNAKKESVQKQLEISYEEMGRIFKLYKHPREQGWTIYEYQNHLHQSYPELQKEISQISRSLNSVLYSKQQKSLDAKSALKSAQSIALHKFEIPMPAEKQILGIKGFIESLTNKKLAQEL